MAKVITFASACQLSSKLKKQGKKVIWTSGFFDILHIGHVSFFSKVRKWAGPQAIIMVGVDTDQNLARTKGSTRPIFIQTNRCRVLASISTIDYVVKLTEKFPREKHYIARLQKINPTGIVFGNTGKNVLFETSREAKKAGVSFKHLPHKIKLPSTSRIAELIQKYYSG